jgi:peptide/nickel transport system substrate-binding protein
LAGVALAFVAAGCSTATPTAPSVTYVGVGGGSISFGMMQSPNGCNPGTPSGDSPATLLVLGAVLPSAFAIGQTGLPTANPNLIVQSELVSTKPETIVYTLNPKAVWSDGVAISAKDFVYAWQQQRQDRSTAQDTVASIAGYRDIKSVTGSDKGHTVTVVFRTPFADWQMLFSNLLPAHVMDKVGWDPACTTVDPAVDLSGGPYRISSVTPGTIVLRTNPKWWGTAPNAKQITVHIATSAAELDQWVQSGFVQVALPSTLTPSFLDQVTSLPGVESSVSLSATLLQLDMASGIGTPLPSDVRLAIALSIDRQALVNQQVLWALPGAEVAQSHLYVQGETGYHPPPSVTTTTNPASAPTTSTSTSTTLVGQGGTVDFPTGPEPDQAADLMAASGYVRPDGGTWETLFGVHLDLHLAVDDADPWAQATATQLATQLESAGFGVSLVPSASATSAGTELADGHADLALLPQYTSPFLSQAVAWYSTLLGPPGQSGSQDWTDYASNTFDSLVTTASQELSPVTAATSYAAADTQLWDDNVALPLFVEPSALIWSRKVDGVIATPTSNSLLWYAQYWAVKVAEPTSSTTPALPTP